MVEKQASKRVTGKKATLAPGLRKRLGGGKGMKKKKTHRSNATHLTHLEEHGPIWVGGKKKRNTFLDEDSPKEGDSVSM